MAQEIGEFGKAYLEAEKELWEECQQMVENGECDEDYAQFRFMMVRDELLESMADAYASSN